MLAFALPSPPVPFYTVKATMDGVDYYLKFEWNQRYGWFMGLADITQSVIFSPRKLVANRNLFKYCTDQRRPRGALVCYDTTGIGKDPTYEDLDERHLLLYYAEAELA